MCVTKLQYFKLKHIIDTVRFLINGPLGCNYDYVNYSAYCFIHFRCTEPDIQLYLVTAQSFTPAGLGVY
jgi:hypothetical protein